MGYAEYQGLAVERHPILHHDGKSGATLERLLLPDGRRYVVKRLAPSTDLVMTLTGDRAGRELGLWSDGVLESLPPEVGHAVVDGWAEPDGAVLVMRDLGGSVLTWDDRLTVGQCRWMVGCVARMHRHFLGRPPVANLTPLPDLLTLFAPARLRQYVEAVGLGSPVANAAVRGWDVFAETVPADVAGPVLVLLEDPARLVAAMERRPLTLVHGDLATVNMAIEDERLLLLDWSMPAAAPGALDLARFVAGCASVVDATREQILDMYRDLAGPAYDETGLRLALLSALVWLGWNKAVDAVEHPDPAVRDREAADLAWWVAQARLTLDAGLL